MLYFYWRYTHNKDIDTVWWGEHFVSPNFCLMYIFQSWILPLEQPYHFCNYFFPLMWKMFEVWATPFIRKSFISLWKSSSKIHVAVGRKALYKSSHFWSNYLNLSPLSGYIILKISTWARPFTLLRHFVYLKFFHHCQY